MSVIVQLNLRSRICRFNRKSEILRGKKIPERSKKQSLNLLSVSNYLYHVSIIFIAIYITLHCLQYHK